MVNKNNDKVLVSVKNVVKRYEKNNIILNDVSFDIKEGECLGLAGESGCGKSTLSKCILGLEKIDSGEIIFAGDKIQNRRSLRPKKGKRIIQAVFQNPTSALNPRMKIIDSLMEPLDNQPWINPSFLKDVRGDRRKVAEKLMSMVKLKKEYLDVYPSSLSGGEKQRVIIARAISVEPALIILDEPTASLDVSIQARVLNLLKDLQEELNLSYLFISHDLSAVNFMCKRIIVMKKGIIVDEFNRDEKFSDKRNEYTKELLKGFMY